ncbi:CBS domain-containing protein [Nocardia sp. CDC159]|uniref:CBS domain-containing protein n=1 Tax=Nocardia pulmonis TaxID=2951408 RepID=A0A9X2E204_9NOCA|nr:MULTISPECIES: CBS domain-containing protein [Nocardia]MCM6772607.1 CBS domain-containing protein [Nocardia pulmonis]MCM6784735.1 CBS domain-containing protein [Nocardia sp. CDC159]
MTTARDIMTPGVECIRSSDTVLEAARKMAHLDVGALPICGEDNQLKGMLTDRDIVVKVIAQRKDPLGVHASELAQGTPVMVQADDDVAKVCEVMSQHQIRRVPVLENDRLVGIVAQADVARQLDNPKAGSVVEAVSQK